MKKLKKIVSLFISVILFYNIVFAESFPVIINKVTGNISQKIYEGDMSNYNGLSLPMSGSDFGIIFDWDDEDSYYLVIPQTPAQSSGNDVNPATFSMIPNNTFNVQPQIDLSSVDAENIIFNDSDVETEIIIKDDNAEEPIFITGVPKEINGDNQNINISLLSENDITATSFNTLIISMTA